MFDDDEADEVSPPKSLISPAHVRTATRNGAHAKHKRMGQFGFGLNLMPLRQADGVRRFSYQIAVHLPIPHRQMDTHLSAANPTLLSHADPPAASYTFFFIL